MDFDIKQIIDWAKLRKVELILLSVLFLISTVLSFLLFQPQARKIMQSQENLKASTKDTSNLRTAQVELANLKKEIISIEEKLVSHEGKLFSQEDSQAFLNYINRISKFYNVRIQKINPLSQVKKEVKSLDKIYLASPYRLSLTCSYHNLGKFLNKLEQSKDRFVRVDSLSVQADSSKTREHKVELGITIFSIM
ncbi:MAG: type 4a pilus biogenesis protein PilO [Candidatus Gygaella obscura]|nr:type 4a pilus biogenesis protein PilO [Candidatus Gygaella obscura]